MRIKENYGGIDVDVSFEDRICVFYDYSGSGKTFLFQIIEEYCQFNGLTCASYDSGIKDVADSIKVKDVDVVLLDNADLYMSKSLFNKLLESNSCIFVSIKSLRFVEETKVGLYRVVYNSNSLTVKRF